MTAVASPAATEELDPRRWKALAVVLVAGFMALLDVSIVNVAIPSISNKLSATSSQVEFVLAGYQLAYAVTLITGGRLGDIFGRKRLFMIGVIGFSAASAFCGLAQSGNMLVISRVAQGAFAALMYPQILSTIQVNFGPKERPKAFGIFGGVIGLATIAGPLVGGLLIQANLLNLDWRPIFLVNVPIGVGAVVAAVFLLHESKAPNAPRLDIPGVVLAGAALFFLTYPLVEGRDAGWPVWIWSMFVAAAVLFAVLAPYLRWRQRHGGSPLIAPVLFTDRAFVVGMAVILVFMSGVPAFFLTFSIFLQVGHAFTALQTGLTTTPFALGSVIASFASARLARRMGNKILALGALLLVVGMLMMLFTLHLIGQGSVNGFALAPALAVAGVGLGCVIAPLINVILGSIHGSNAGSASGVLTTFQQVGGALGVAVVGVIFFGLLASHASAVSVSDAGPFRTELVATGLPSPVVNTIDGGLTRCFNDEANSNDLNTLPPSCIAFEALAPRGHTPQDVRVGSLISSQIALRLGSDFDLAFERAVLYNMVVWAITAFLVLLLPRAQAPPPWAAQAGH